MSLCGDEKIKISLDLVECLLKSAKKYCKRKGLSEKILPELLGSEELGRFARGLNLKVEVKSCTVPRPEGLDLVLGINSKQNEIQIVI